MQVVVLGVVFVGVFLVGWVVARQLHVFGFGQNSPVWKNTLFMAVWCAALPLVDSFTAFRGSSPQNLVESTLAGALVGAIVGLIGSYWVRSQRRRSGN